MKNAILNRAKTVKNGKPAAKAAAKGKAVAKTVAKGKPAGMQRPPFVKKPSKMPSAPHGHASPMSYRGCNIYTLWDKKKYRCTMGRLREKSFNWTNSTYKHAFSELLEWVDVAIDSGKV